MRISSKRLEIPERKPRTGVLQRKSMMPPFLRQSINIAMALVREKMEQEHARQFHVPIKPLYTGEILRAAS